MALYGSGNVKAKATITFQLDGAKQSLAQIKQLSGAGIKFFNQMEELGKTNNSVADSIGLIAQRQSELTAATKANAKALAEYAAANDKLNESMGNMPKPQTPQQERKQPAPKKAPTRGKGFDNSAQAAKEAREQARRDRDRQKNARRKTADNGVQQTVGLAKALGQDFDAAKALRLELGLTAKQTKVAVNALKGLRDSNASTDESFEQLAQTLGLSKRQFDALSTSVDQIPKKQQNTGASMAMLAQQFFFVKEAVQSIAAIAGPAYDFLIGSNEKLNQALLKSQSVLAATTKLTNVYGAEFGTVTESIEATGPALRKELLQLQKDTALLSGVTTQQVNEVFNTVLLNSKFAVGQTKRNNGDIVASMRELSVGITAAIGTLGMPLEQVAQETRALLSGDINNPDAALIKQLSITKEEFAQAQGRGELIDFLIGKFESMVVASSLASNSISAIAVNFVDAIEQMGMIAGEPLIEPILAEFKALNTFLYGGAEGGGFLEGFLVSGAAAGEKVAVVVKEIIAFAKNLAVAIGPALKTAFDFAAIGVEALVTGITVTLKVANQLLTWSNEFRDRLAEAIPLIKFLQQGMGEGAANLIDSSRAGLARLTGGFNDAVVAQEMLGKRGNSYAVQAKKNTDELLALDKLRLRAAEEGRELTEAEKQAASATLMRSKIGADLLRENIEEQKNLTLFTDEQREARDAEVAKLEETLGLVDELSNKVIIAPKDFEDLGTTVEAFSKDYALALQGIEAAADIEQLNRNAEATIGLVDAVQAFGAIDTDKIIADLQGIAQNSAISAEIRSQAISKITDVLQKQAEVEQATLDVKQGVIDAELALGQLSEGDASVKQAELEAERQLLELESKRAELVAIKDIGSKEQIATLEAGIASLEQSAIAAEANIANARFKADAESASKQYEKTNSLIEARLKERQAIVQVANDSQLKVQEQLTALSLELEKDATEERLIALEERKKAQEAVLADSANINQAEKASLEAELLATQGEITDAKSNVIKLRADIINELIKAEAKANQQVAQNLEVQLDISEAARIAAAGNANAIGDSVRGNYAKLKLEAEQAQSELQTLLAIEAPQDASARLALEQQVADAKARTAKAGLELVKQQAKAEADLRAEELEAIKGNNELKQESIDAEISFLELRSEYADSLLKAEQDLIGVRQDALDEATGLLELVNVDEGQAAIDTLSAEIDKLKESELDADKLIAEQKQAQLDELTAAQEAEAEKRLEVEKQVATQRLKDLGLEDATEQSLAQQKLDAAVQLADLERTSLENRLKLEKESLELEMQKAELAKQAALLDAEQASIEAEQKLADLQFQLAQANKAGDSDSAALLEKQIASQTRLTELAQGRTASIEQQAKLEQESFALRAKSLATEATVERATLAQKTGESIASASADAAASGLSFDAISKSTDEVRQANKQDMAAIDNLANAIKATSIETILPEASARPAFAEGNQLTDALAEARTVTSNVKQFARIDKQAPSNNSAKDSDANAKQFEALAKAMQKQSALSAGKQPASVINNYNTPPDARASLRLLGQQ